MSCGKNSWRVIGDAPLNIGGSLDIFEVLGGPYSFQAFKGEIAQLRYWTIERSQEEIATYMDQALPLDAGSAVLSGLWPMDDPGALPHIAAAEISNLSLTHHGTFHKQFDFTTAWTQIEGNAIDVGAGTDGSVWVIDNHSHQVYRDTGAGWLGMGGNGNRIDSGPNNDAYVVVADGGVWYSNGDVGNWSPLPGEIAAKDVGVGADGSVWALRAADDRVFRHDGSTWQDMGGNGKRIDAGPDGDAYVVVADGGIWYGNGAEGNWAPLEGAQANDISVGADGSVWITYDDGGIGRWNAAESTWERSAGQAQQISVDQDGVPWVVQASAQIWTGEPQ